MLKTRISCTMLCWLLCGGLAAAQSDEAPRAPSPFDAGNIRLGLGLGWTSSGDTDWMILGVGAGYFAVDGLELGLDSTLWVLGDPFIATATPGVRYVLHFVPILKPYVGTFYRRYFIADDFDDSNSLGARAGVYFVSDARLFVGGGLIYERFLDQNLYRDQDQIYPELTIAFTF